MRGAVPFLFIVMFASACAGISSRPPEDEGHGETVYCSLLHVPAGKPVRPGPRPYLGIYLGSSSGQDTGEAFPCERVVRVGGVIAGTAAAEVGIREDDRILALDGIPVCELGPGDPAAAFKTALEKKAVGAAVQLTIRRGDENMLVSAGLRARPYAEQSEAPHEGLLACGDEGSVLGRELVERGAVTEFGEVIEGLAERSNLVHNVSWFERGLSNPFQFPEMTAMLRHPLATGAVAGGLTDRLVESAAGPDWSAAGIVGDVAGMVGVAPLTEGGVPGTLEAFVGAVEESARRMGSIRKEFSDEEILLLREAAPRAWDGGGWNEYLEASLKVDRGAILSALQPVLGMLTRGRLEELRRDLTTRYGNASGVLFERETTAGTILVVGSGNDIHTADAALIMDLGGNDLYLNNAGGTRQDIPISLLVDWDGDDVYFSREPFSQGGGMLGAGMLVDLGGSDVFSGGDRSQGAGILGVGFLLNEGRETVFSAGRFSQGIGQWGVGVLVNRDGRTGYESEGWGQGIGLPGGGGVLVDTGGDDHYRVGGAEPDHRDPERSTVSMGQGFGEGFRPDGERLGVSGGLGVLVDVSGDDNYLADYFAQGSSYYFAVGVLDDRAGNDRYLAGRYAQGAGVHASVGVLRDRAGNDSYVATYGVSEGMGHDFGVGFLQDDRGDDVFHGGTLVQGAATRGGVGILVDVEGSDSYASDSSSGGYAQDGNCVGIMMDVDAGSGREAGLRVGMLPEP